MKDQFSCKKFEVSACVMIYTWESRVPFFHICLHVIVSVCHCVCVSHVYASLCLCVTCLCITVSMCYCVYASLCLCVAVSMCHMSVCHCVCVSPCLCRSDPMLSPCLCVPVPVCLHNLWVCFSQKPRFFQLSRNAIRIDPFLFAYTFFSFIFLLTHLKNMSLCTPKA